MQKFQRVTAQLNTPWRISLVLGLILMLASCAVQQSTSIDRQALVTRHNPVLHSLDPESPFTVGNGKFAFTADVTGFQSFADLYFDQGMPLETKARWAWHSRPNPEHFQLRDSNETYQAYGREVAFPTHADSDAGAWLRQNPHDLPLARIALNYRNQPLNAQQIGNVNQLLNLWQGVLTSQFELDEQPMKVTTLVAPDTDTLAFELRSPLLGTQQLSITLAFPRGYDLSVKNTPSLIWDEPSHHSTEVVELTSQSALIARRIDDARHWVRLSWQGDASIVVNQQHQVSLQLLAADAGTGTFALAVEFDTTPPTGPGDHRFDDILAATEAGWQTFWHSGAALDFTGSNNVQADELERRIILSQYLMAVQERATIPAQETGLTSSSWYGKFHTEMTWWHSAHWALWGREQSLESTLDWYVNHLETARETAHQRGLKGARWAKMVGPDGRESPGGNPLIIWNQPHPIALAELIYQRTHPQETLRHYAELVEETAKAMSSMLTWQPDSQRFSLTAPIWIAQEHYPVTEVVNPSFEISQWYTGLQTAQLWRQRLGLAPNPLWQQQIDNLASLPHKDGKYVAIESIPDTFDNLESRNDHPTMLAMWGLLSDDRVDPEMMQRTLDAVIQEWDFEERIWGWDYPMIAMTASKLNQPQVAVDALLMRAHNNYYANNGHCRQKKVGLPAYLPANGALLAAVAFMAAQNPDSSSLGFPADGSWRVRAEGF